MQPYKGNCIVTGRRSPYTLYNYDFATFGEDEVYNQADAKGFINLFGPPPMSPRWPRSSARIPVSQAARPQQFSSSGLRGC